MKNRFRRTYEDKTPLLDKLSLNNTSRHLSYDMGDLISVSEVTEIIPSMPTFREKIISLEMKYVIDYQSERGVEESVMKLVREKLANTLYGDLRLLLCDLHLAAIEGDIDEVQRLSNEAQRLMR